jgi:CBS domain-containing protein
MTLEDIMVREVVQALPAESIAEAAKRMHEKAVGCLVATVNGAVKGIITDRDLLDCLAESHDPYRCQVVRHMRRPVFVLRPEEDAATAAKVLSRRRIKRLPVAKNGRLLGIVSLSDLAALANEEAGKLQTPLEFFADVVNAQAAQSSGARPSSRAAAAPVAPQAAAATDADIDADELIDAGGPG